MPLFDDGGHDKLLLPDKYHFGGRGSLVMFWRPPNGNSDELYSQTLQIFSCVPVVIIPTDTVPIDYRLFFVSPFHKRSDAFRRDVPLEAAQGLPWTEDEPVE